MPKRLIFIGYSYAERDINSDEAEAMIVKALKIKPDNGFHDWQPGLGAFLNKTNSTSAIKNLKEAMEILPADAAIGLNI